MDATPLSQRNIPADLGPRFEWKPMLRTSISDVGGDVDKIKADGACGRYSFIEAASALSDCPPRLHSLQDKDQNFTLIYGDWQNMVEFSRIVAEWMQRHRTALLDRTQSFFIDKDSQRMGPSIGLSTVCHDSYYDKRNDSKVDEFTYNMLRMYDGSSTFSEKTLPPYYWFSSLCHLPICCLCWGVSVLYYFTEDGKEKSRLHWYRDDGRVQIFDDHLGFAVPFPGVAVIKHEGSHYESVKFPHAKYIGTPPTQVTVPSPLPVETMLQNPVGILLSFLFQQSRLLVSRNGDFTECLAKPNLSYLIQLLSVWKNGIMEEFENRFPPSVFGEISIPLSEVRVNPTHVFTNDDVFKPPSPLEKQKSVFFIMLWSSICPVNKVSITRILICLMRHIDNNSMHLGEQDPWNYLWCIFRSIAGLSWWYYLERTDQITAPQSPSKFNGIEVLFTGPPIKTFSNFFNGYMFSNPRPSYSIYDYRLTNTFVSQDLLHFFTLSSLSYYQDIVRTAKTNPPEDLSDKASIPCDENLLKKIGEEMRNYEEVMQPNKAQEVLVHFLMYWIERPIMFEHFICSRLKQDSHVVNYVQHLFRQDKEALHTRNLEKTLTANNDADNQAEDDCDMHDKPRERSRFIDDEAVDADAVTDDPPIHTAGNPPIKYSTPRTPIATENNNNNRKAQETNDEIEYSHPTSPPDFENDIDVEARQQIDDKSDPTPGDLQSETPHLTPPINPDNHFLKGINQHGGEQTNVKTARNSNLLQMVKNAPVKNIFSSGSISINPKLSKGVSDKEYTKEPPGQKKSKSNDMPSEQNDSKVNEAESAQRYHSARKRKTRVTSSQKDGRGDDVATSPTAPTANEAESAKKYSNRRRRTGQR